MSLVCYLCIGMLGVGTLYWITRNVCQAWLEVFSTRHQTIPMIYHTWSGWSRQNVSGKEKWILELVNFLYVYCLYIYTLICFCLVGKIFLDKKIKPALTAIAQGLKWESSVKRWNRCEKICSIKKKTSGGSRNNSEESMRHLPMTFVHRSLWYVAIQNFYRNMFPRAEWQKKYCWRN